MKKRYILLAGLLALCFAAVGCGKKDNTAKPTPTPEATIETSGKGNVVSMEQSADIDKSKITKIMGTKTATSADVVITNNTGLEISGFYTRPSGEDDWSADYIEEKFTLKDKEMALFYYDPMAKDEDGNTITKYDLKVSYTDEDETDCLFRNLTLSDINDLKLKMEDGVPFVTYISVSTKRQVSTLEDAKARMGKTDSDDEDENNDSDNDSSESADTTPTPSDSDSDNSDDGSSSNNPTGNGNNDGNPGSQDPGNIDYEDGRETAENYIGQDINALTDACGGANSTEYTTDPESGVQIGYYYYNGYTVSTTQQDGQEIVNGVW